MTGVGYDPTGAILKRDESSAAGQSPALLECLRAGLLCNDSVLVEKEGRWEVQGDPTEGALIVAAAKGGLSAPEAAEQFPRLDVIPFESERQFMATLHDTGEAPRQVAYVKGAVEILLDRCAEAFNANGARGQLNREQVMGEVERMASSGLRVLAFASKEISPEMVPFDHEAVASGLCFLGLQGMIDPPRAEAISAVEACHTAGIRIKMITGDHAITASAIAAKIGIQEAQNGLADSQPVLTGKALAKIPDQELSEVAEKTAVFARVDPEQKLRLVEALQARGHVVAMTGDGVNDAPALKRANIGIAMGITGTEVAKEAADMILTDDNFATIEAAVEEGRGFSTTSPSSLCGRFPPTWARVSSFSWPSCSGRPCPSFPSRSCTSTW